MDRGEYNTCVARGLKGKTLSKDERKLEFCIVAKLCSSKSKDREEAKVICLLPKEPKPIKEKKSRRGKIDIGTLTVCVMKGLDGSEPTLANLSPILAGCTRQKVEKPLTRERFIKNCFKENTAGNGFQYDIKEAQRLRSFCTAKWKEQEVVA